MPKSIKLKDNTFWDSTGIIYKDSSGAKYVLKDNLADIYSQLTSLKNNTVETSYLGNTANINNLHYKNGIYGIYGASNPIDGQIAILEVLVYSSDWVIQRLTQVSGTPQIYQRAYYSGTTWSNWVRLH